VPIAQLMHAVAPEERLLYEPAAQVLHRLAPGWSLYVPATHAVHVLAANGSKHCTGQEHTQLGWLEQNGPLNAMGSGLVRQ